MILSLNIYEIRRNIRQSIRHAREVKGRFGVLKRYSMKQIIFFTLFAIPAWHYMGYMLESQTEDEPTIKETTSSPSESKYTIGANEFDHVHVHKRPLVDVLTATYPLDD
ncbi:hypothetical protein Ddc_03438 [Ditylenchus destructor]|nr:hypothetical protein Ddc_03438 [Ditylenchus destructor]